VGAATLDVRWLVRNNSAINPDTGAVIQPAHSYQGRPRDRWGGFLPRRLTIAVSRQGSQITITYTGTLESSADVASGYAAVPGASSPYTVTADQLSRFYRARQ
jgi:hypothetical protein